MGICAAVQLVLGVFQFQKAANSPQSAGGRSRQQSASALLNLTLVAEKWGLYPRNSTIATQGGWHPKEPVKTLHIGTAASPAAKANPKKPEHETVQPEQENA